MGRGATKVAVSIPDDLYQTIEKIRNIPRRSRSAVVQDALRHWLHAQAQSARVREYEAGFRRRPDSRLEVKAAEAAAVRLLSRDDWACVVAKSRMSICV